MNLRSGYSNVRNRTRRYVRPTIEEFDTRDFLAVNAPLIPVGYAEFLLKWSDGTNQTSYTFSNTPYTFSDGTRSSVAPYEIVGRTLGFKPWGGRLRQDWTEMTEQQLSFTAFVDELSKDEFISGNVYRADEAIRRLMYFFDQRRETIAQLIYYTNEVLKRMCVSPLCTPQDRDPRIEDGMFRKPIEGGMAISLLTILVPDTFHAKPPTMDLITAGRGTALSMKRFIESYYLHTDVMPKASYFKTEIVEQAFINMPDGPLKMSLKQTILGAPEKHHFIFPARVAIDDGQGNASRWYSQRMLARAIVDSYPHDFGYVKRFYYTPRP
jgi:hypothetical protein